MKWISVNDILPQPNNLVLIRVKKNSFGHSCVAVGCWLGKEVDENLNYRGWLVPQNDIYFIKSNTVEEDNITHWMPLPEFPNE